LLPYKPHKAKTRQTLRQGFARLHLDNLLINETLQQLIVGVEVLHCRSQPQFCQNSSRINRRRLPKIMPIYYYCMKI
jgi:hypothetical protein